MMEKDAVAMELDFFFFFGSTHSYLSVMRIEELAARAGVSVNWRPFSVRALMREQGNTFHTISPRTAYMWRDIERRAAEHGLPFVRPPIWPTDPDQLANRVGIVAASEGWCPAYARASFRSWYLDGKELGDLAGLSAVLRELGKAAEDSHRQGQLGGRAGPLRLRNRCGAQTGRLRGANFCRGAGDLLGR
jgi:2-hydroxychromene-2-carboxylate isomerase